MTRRDFLVRLMALVAAPAALVSAARLAPPYGGRWVTYDEMLSEARMRTLGSLGRGGYFTSDEIARLMDQRYRKTMSRALYESEQQRKARMA